MKRLFIITGLLIGFAGMPAMACPDNLESSSNCVTEMDTNQVGTSDSRNPSGDRDIKEPTSVCLTASTAC